MWVAPALRADQHRLTTGNFAGGRPPCRPAGTPGTRPTPAVSIPTVPSLTRSLTLLLSLILILASPLPAQVDVSFSLATKDGRTRFRVGEAVTVQMRFRAQTPGRYVLTTAPEGRTTRTAEFDHFSATGAVDPLADIPALMSGGLARNFSGVPLDANPQVIERDVNEWLSFRKPGSYRVQAETRRVFAIGASTPIVLRAEPIEIEIIAASPAWAAGQLAEAVAVLEKTPPARSQQFGVPPPPNPAADSASERAARMLRFLETSQAVAPLVRFHAADLTYGANQLRAGLFASPHRKEVIAQMEALLIDPAHPVTYFWLGTLVELSGAASAPRRAAMPVGDDAAMKRWQQDDLRFVNHMQALERRYFDQVAQALPNKRGTARAVTLETLVTRSKYPVQPETTAALIEVFPQLPEGSQYSLLTMEWSRIAGPGIEAMLQTIAAKPGLPRDAALERLMELNPASARNLVLNRIRKGDIAQGMNPRTLLLLPDKELPELDTPLVEAFEQGKPVEALLARYATAAVLSRLRAHPRARQCSGPLAAYFFRVDPAFAAAHLAEVRKQQPGCALHLGPFEDLLASPGLIQAAIHDLTAGDPALIRPAQAILQHAGTLDAREPLWDGMARLRISPAAPLDQGNEFGYAEALLRGAGWILTSAELDKLQAACRTESCRSYVASERRSFASPILIGQMPPPVGGWRVGPFLLRSATRLDAKLRQYPKGTPFRLELGSRGTWLAEQTERQIRTAVANAGGRIVP